MFTKIEILKFTTAITIGTVVQRLDVVGRTFSCVQQVGTWGLALSYTFLEHWSTQVRDNCNTIVEGIIGLLQLIWLLASLIWLVASKLLHCLGLALTYLFNHYPVEFCMGTALIAVSYYVASYLLAFYKEMVDKMERERTFRERDNLWRTMALSQLVKDPQWLRIKTKVQPMRHMHIAKAAKVDSTGTLPALLNAHCPSCQAAVYATLPTKQVMQLLQVIEVQSTIDVTHVPRCPFSKPYYNSDDGDWSYYYHLLRIVCETINDFESTICEIINDFEVQTSVDNDSVPPSKAPGSDAPDLTFNDRVAPSPMGEEIREGKRAKSAKRKFQKYLSGTWDQADKADTPEERAQLVFERTQQLYEDWQENLRLQGDGRGDEAQAYILERRFFEMLDQADMYFGEQDATEGQRGRRARELWDEATSSNFRAHRREGIKLPAEKPLRQGDEGTIMHVTEKGFVHYTPEDISAAITEEMVRSQESLREHQRVLEQYTTVPVREGGPNNRWYCAECNRYNLIEYHGTTTYCCPMCQGGEHQSRPGRRKVEYVRESMLPNRIPAPLGGSTVYLVNGKDHRMGIMQHVNVNFAVGTCRHRYVDGRDVDCIWTVGSTIDVHTVTRKYTATIMKYYAVPEQDEVWYFTDLKVGQVLDYHPPAYFKYEQETAQMLVGEVVQGYHAHMDDSQNPVWTVTGGVVKNVTKYDNHYVVGYDASTLDGYCRTPMYNSKGKVLVGHLYGGKRQGNGPRFNAGETWHPPTGAHLFTSEHDPMEFEDVPRQGVVVQAGNLPCVVENNLRRHTEPYKIYPLRSDKNLKGINCAYYLMKPSTELNKKEIQRYGDKLKYTYNKRIWDHALAAALEMDYGTAVPFCEPTRENVSDMIEKLKSDRTNAGFPADNRTHNDYIADLGDGDIEAGKEVLIQRVLGLYKYMTGVDRTPDYQKLWFECKHWSVNGKKDGYKQKKLDVGRTIQCPAMEMKILWRVCYGENDQEWIQRHTAPEHWVHAGQDFDWPVVGERREKISKAKGAGALDATAFDRYMEKEYIHSFFLVHLRLLAPGASKEFLECMYEFVTEGPLVISDGTVYLKDRGNPSGFMNTLRLNCWANLVAWCYAYARRLEQQGELTYDNLLTLIKDDIYMEICGDDSRMWALTDRAVHILDLEHEMQAILDIWNEELPWSVKLEGCVVFPEGISMKLRAQTAPTMVSRGLVYVNNVLWEPLCDVSRCLKRLVHDDNRTCDEELELVNSAYNTLGLLVWWSLNGKLRSAALEAFLREFPTEDGVSLARQRASELYQRC